MNTIDDIVTAFGGPSQMSRRLGFEYPARISDWKRRGSIPASRWPSIIEAARQEGISGISAEVLLRVHASPKPAS